MKRKKMTFFVMLVLGIVLLVPECTLALTDETIYLGEDRDCGGFSDPSTTGKIENVSADETASCYHYNSSTGISMTRLKRRKGPEDTAGYYAEQDAFRLHYDGMSPGRGNYLDIEVKTLVKSPQAKCELDNNLFSRDDDMSKGFRAGLGTIMEGSLSIDGDSSNFSGTDYYYGSLAMSKFIGNYKDSYSFLNIVYNTQYEKLVEKAIHVYELVYNETVTGEHDIRTSFTKDGNDWVSDEIELKNIKLLSKQGNNPFTITLKNEAGKSISDKVEVRKISNSDTYNATYEFIVDGTDLAEGKYTISIKVNDSLSYSSVNSIYDCGSGYTPVVIRGDLTKKTLNINESIDGSFTVVDSDSGEEDGGNSDSEDDENIGTQTTIGFDIGFQELGTFDYIPGVKFDIYSTMGSNKMCSGTKIAYDKTSFDSLLAVDGLRVSDVTKPVCLKVTKVPEGYQMPTTDFKSIVGERDFIVILSKEEIENSTKNIGVRFIYNNNQIENIKYSIYQSTEVKDGEIVKCVGKNFGTATSLLTGTSKMEITGVEQGTTLCVQLDSTNKEYFPYYDIAYESGDRTVYLKSASSEEKEEETPSEPEVITSGSVSIRVIDKDKKVITNAKISFCVTKDCKNKDEYSNNGVYEKDKIPFGVYYLVIDVPDGYVTPETITFTLNSDKLKFERDIMVEKKTPVPNTLSNASKMFLACGIVGILAGIYLVYTNAKKQEQV